MALASQSKRTKIFTVELDQPGTRTSQWSITGWMAALAIASLIVAKVLHAPCFVYASLFFLALGLLGLHSILRSEIFTIDPVNRRLIRTVKFHEFTISTRQLNAGDFRRIAITSHRIDPCLCLYQAHLIGKVKYTLAVSDDPYEVIASAKRVGTALDLKVVSIVPESRV